MITTEQIKDLRDRTGISIMQCKKALEESGGDMDKAIIILNKKSSQIAEKKSGRTLGSGVVQSYIHAGGSVGSMVELLCESDFVAKNEEFKSIAYNIAMHIAATNPEFLKKEDISEGDIEKAREVFSKEVEEEKADQSEDLKEKILKGKIDAYFKDKILLEQMYIKDPNQSINNLVESVVQKFGEKTEIGHFIRFSIN